MRTHSGEAPYTCPTCGKSFKQKNNLTLHLRVHTGERNKQTNKQRTHVCSVCDKSFFHNGSLVRHMKTHSEETPHTCPTCGKSFKRKTILTRHITIHTRTCPYVCSVCDKSFFHNGSLIRHMKTHSEDTLIAYSNLCNYATHTEAQDNLANGIEAHQSQDVSEAHISEVNNSSSTCNLSTAPRYRTGNEGLPKSISTVNKIKSNVPGPHLSEAPYIMNIKIEDDFNIKQEEDI